MNVKQNLLNSIGKLGWHLSEESVDVFLQENKNLNSNDLIKLALDCDLRNIGAKSLSEAVSSGRCESFEGPCVLQLVKTRNIAAPKDNETSNSAPPMYKITLTDGISNCNALTVDDVNRLNLNTPPGTKLLLKDNIKIKSNLLILNNQVCQVLGGHVEYLVNKWKTTKELSQHVRAVNSDSAAPPWVPFGTRQINQVDTSKKVFGQDEKQEEDKTSEFSQARQAALAEAMEAKLKITKTFTQQTIDKSQIAVSSVTAPSSVNASASLPASSSYTQTAKPLGKPSKGRGRKGKNLDYDDEEDYRESKDSAKPTAVTLFDLVKTRLDIKEPEPENDSAFVVDNERRPYDSDNRRGNNSENQRGDRNQRSNNDRGRNNRKFNSRNPQNQFNQFHQNENSSNSKQVYDKDDFSYDLGDTTDVKNLKQIKTPFYSNKPETSYKPETASIATTSTTTSKQTTSTSNTNATTASSSSATKSNSFETQQKLKPTNNISNNAFNEIEEKISNTQKTNYQSQPSTSNNNNSNNNNNNSLTQQQQDQQSKRPYQSKQYQNNQADNNNYSNNNPNRNKTRVFYNNEYQNRQYNNSNSNNNKNNNNYEFNQNNSNFNINPLQYPPQMPAPPPPIPAQAVIYSQPPYIPIQTAQIDNQSKNPTYFNNQQPPNYYLNNDFYQMPAQMIPIPPPSQGVGPIQNQYFQPALANQQTQFQNSFYPSSDNNNFNNNYNNYNNSNPQTFSRSKDFNNRTNWKNGDECLARYHDNKFYPALIQSINKNANRCVVSYIGYNEQNEINLNDIKPMNQYTNSNQPIKNNYNNNNSNYRNRQGQGKQQQYQQQNE